MKKRLYQYLAVLFVFLLLIVSCSMFGDDSSDPSFDSETELFEDEEDDEEDEDQEQEQEEEDALPEPSVVLLSGLVISETEIVFEFSMPVNLLSLSFHPNMEVFDSLQDGSTVTVILEEELEPGFRFVAELDLEDEQENFFNKQVSLISRNERFPDLLINELRTEYSGSPFRDEYIEFRMLSDGNLGGLRVFIASNPNNPLVYEFSPFEVKEDEYVVLYLRTPTSIQVPQNDRIFQVPGSSKWLRKTDAVYVMDLDDQVLAAVMISENPGASWSHAHFSAAAELLFAQGAWTSPSGGAGTPNDAVSSADIRTSTTRSISRDETVDDTRTAADWYVTANSGATPGFENDTRRFN